MLARDFLRSNKNQIQFILTGNRRLIVDKCYKEGLITELDHKTLSNIKKGTEMNPATELLDNIMGKGEKRCKKFLDFLEIDEDIPETFPQLEDLLLNYTPILPKLVAESSSTVKTDDVRPDTKPKPKKDVDEPYPLNSKPTGLCFIINNVNFDCNKPRHGSDADAEKLAKVFSWLGFRALMSKDQTKDQMDQVLKCLSASDLSKLVDFKVKEWSDGTFTDLQDVPAHGDAFICCILSYGTTGVVYGTDRKHLAIKDIKKMFNATEHSPLTNKPKVFLIQACEEKETHAGVVLPDVEPDDLPPSSIPAPDFLVSMSTLEDYKSHRNRVRGSWYIQTVCKQMEEGCPSGFDMLTILQQINGYILQSDRMGRERMRGFFPKQMPEIRSTLTKKLVFSPHSKFSMSATDTLRRKKTAIVESLSKKPWVILDRLCKKKLITDNEYTKINQYKNYRMVHTIVYIILDKGEAKCTDFLDLLKTDEMKRVYPGLERIELNYTVRPQRPKKETSSADDRDHVAPESNRQNQELKKRITNLCLAMNNPTEGSVRHGSAIDAGHLFEGVEKIFPLKNPLGSEWILGGVSDTIYKGKYAEIDGWGKFYLPEEVKMTVIGVINGTSCPNEQLVLMICEDGALYAYDGEELHAVALNVDQLLDKGIEYPAAKSYCKGYPFKDMTKEQWAEVRKGAVGKRLDEEHRKLVMANMSNILKILKSTKQLKAVAKAEALTRSICALDEAEYYALTHNPRGWCLIINNEKFTGQALVNRRGTQEDTKALREAFLRLGFMVDVQEDLTADEIRTKLKNLGSKNFLDHDALVVCVLSHGDKGVVFGSDEREVYLEELTQPFTSDRAPTLAGKPKLFFIEASQGSGFQRGALPCPPQPRQEELSLPTPETTTQVEVVYHRKGDKGESCVEEDAWAPLSGASVASDADFLIGMSTISGYKSFRNTATGSIYTQELCRQLMKSAGSSEMDDIHTILMRVNREVNKLNLLSHKQMPQPNYTLTKKLVLKFV